MALKEIVSHENNGLLFDTADDLPWQLRRLLEDSELRERVVRTAKEQVTQYYTVERMGRDYEDLYKAVLNPELGTTSSSCSGAGLAADE